MVYVPAVKSGRTKKFSCLWQAPYTTIDKTSAVNYRIQLLGYTNYQDSSGTSKQIVSQSAKHQKLFTSKIYQYMVC